MVRKIATKGLLLRKRVFADLARSFWSVFQTVQAPMTVISLNALFTAAGAKD